MSGSYTKKVLNVTITLGQGAFGDSGKNTVRLTGLRVTATILKSGTPALDRAMLRVYGVPASIMNQVSTLGIPLQMIRLGNTVTLEAGDVNGTSIVYSGYMHECYQDLSEAPESALMINAFGGMDQAIKPVPPISFPGPISVATIMSGLATTMGMTFENSGVTTVLPASYFPGTALQQAQDVARAADIEMAIDTATLPNTLAIWPKNGTRGGQIPLINAASGLIGYPTFQSSGMGFQCLYNPNIRLGAQIKMESTAGAAAAGSASASGNLVGGPNGFWYVTSPLSHNLSSELPGGPWSTEVSCSRVPGSPGS
jgi:hypothetical protein